VQCKGTAPREDGDGVLCAFDGVVNVVKELGAVVLVIVLVV
jgi:hypothetical protein